jgi:hypothetical protein
MKPRGYTTKLYELISEGIVDKDYVLNACLNHMSEDEIRDMMESNDLIDEEPNEEDED